MSRTVAVHVHIAGRRFAPGDVMPDELAAKVKNQAVWAATEAPLNEGGELPSGVVPVHNGPGAEPPRSGKGSGRDAWAAYAEARGVSVPDEASRDDIIFALDLAAGKIGE